MSGKLNYPSPEEFEEMQRKASVLPFKGGSLTFRMCVANGQWDAVDEMLPLQEEPFHGISPFSNEDLDAIQALRDADAARAELEAEFDQMEKEIDSVSQISE